MGAIAWQYAESTHHLVEVLNQLDGTARLHGGGTAILRNPPEAGTLVDLHRAGLTSIEREGAGLTLGAMVTFSDALAALRSWWPVHVAALGLATAAVPSLRNRITLGGSIAFFPPWSSIVGPLTAVDAELSIVGPEIGATPRRVSLPEYYADRALHRNTAITSVTIPRAAEWTHAWRAVKRVGFEYAACGIAVVYRKDDGGAIKDARIVLTGGTSRLHRLSRVEQAVTGTSVENLHVTEEMIDTTIPPRRGMSGAYLRRRVAVEIERCFQEEVSA